MAATLSPHAADDDLTGKRYDRRLVRRLLVYVRPYKRLVAGALILLMTEGLLQLVGPILTQRVIDVALPTRDTGLAARAHLAQLLLTANIGSTLFVENVYFHR